MKTFVVALALCVCAALAFPQGNLGRIDGSVSDPTGAAVPGADVQLTGTATGQTFKTTTNERGEWTIPALQAGSYKVVVTKPGFKAATVNNIALSAGVPAMVPVKLEVGQATETVTVEGGAEIVQATSAEVSNTITGRQITELPFATRNAVELIVTQPGTSTPTNPRSSTINGLPKGAINITIDGMNTQDNLLKSSDGFFSYIMPSVDSLEEVTLTTSAGGVDSTAQGAAQIKFVTKSGTNQFHGGTFYQVRNTFFNANYFFNNQNNLPRDIIHLRQYGGHIGGPIVKDKVFFFTNYERYRYPGTSAYSKSVPLAPYTQGNYTYQDSGGALHTVNLLNIAAAANPTLPATTRQYPTTVDPIVAQTYAQVLKYTNGGNLRSNAGSNDYNSQTYSFQPTGLDSRDFLTARLDYNVTQKHHVSFSYDYNKYNSIPDFLNGITPVYAGTGTVLGTDISTGQRSNRFVGVLSLRSAINSRLTNELRGGLNGGTVLFFDAVNPGLFNEWKGFSPGITYAAITTTRSPQRRNGPYKDLADTVSWVKGSHQITAGVNWSRVEVFQRLVSTESIPTITFNTATNDPLITGTAAPFLASTGSFPGATNAQISSMASAYANLVGRVSAISRQRIQDETSHQYAYNSPRTDRNREEWWGLYAQDVWRIAPSLTATFGVRWEKEGRWENVNQTYSSVTQASLFGLSGVNNLFKPGTLTGIVPTFDQLTDANTYKMPAVWAPSLGLAWQVPGHEGFLGKIFGTHQGASVFRGGYSISTVREGSEVYLGVYGSNQGLSQDASLSPTTFPADFGPVGSVLFRDAALPQRSGLPASPIYPIPVTFTSNLNGFDPNLKMSYVQSWNIGWQRELGRNTVIEARYTGNHGLKQWRQYILNEVNTQENGFVGLFNAAANNLRIARGGDILQNQSVINYGNQGLAGQVAIPFIQSVVGSGSDSTMAGYLTLGQVGSMANALATNQTRFTNMVNAGYVSNFFLVNPTIAGGTNYIVKNDGSSFYDAGQFEVRRRMAAGFQIQGSYVWSKSMANGATANSDTVSQPTSLRNLGLDKSPDPFDIRHAIKANYLYELPFGRGRHYLASVHNVVARKALEGWQMAGVARWQSGVPFNPTGGFSTFNNNGSGWILHNMTMQQLQDSVSFRKGQNPVTGLPAVYMIPPPVPTTGLTSANNTNFITNTQAAYNQNNLTPAQVNPNAPYIGPAGPGQMGCIRCYVHLPWQRHFDVSLVKITHIRESVTLEFRAQALNVFNITNFNAGAGVGSTFGLVTTAYRDISGTVDPGGRILEFVGRINF